MGQPAEMTPDEQTAACHLATETVDAVRKDEGGPFELPDFDGCRSTVDIKQVLKDWWSRIDLQAFQIAQLACNLRRALDLACDALEADTDGDNRLLGKQLRALDLPPSPDSDEPAPPTSTPAPVTRSGRELGAKVPPLPAPPAKG